MDTGKFPGINLAAYAVALGILVMAPDLRAQTDRFYPRKNDKMWSADTLYMGASFARLSNAPVIVWLKANDAGWIGELSVIEPGTGRHVRLFTNHSRAGQKVTISDMIDIPIGATVTFEYTVINTNTGGARGLAVAPSVWWPKYTGPNRKGSKYRSRAGSDNRPSLERKDDHRWSVMGRVNKDILEFGFEDNTASNSDMDFNDIVFQTLGLSMVREDKGIRNRSYLW